MTTPPKLYVRGGLRENAWHTPATPSDILAAGYVPVDQLCAAEQRVAELTAEQTRLHKDYELLHGIVDELDGDATGAQWIGDRIRRALSRASAAEATVERVRGAISQVSNSYVRQHLEAALAAGSEETLLEKAEARSEQRKDWPDWKRAGINVSDHDPAGNKSMAAASVVQAPAVDGSWPAGSGRSDELEQLYEIAESALIVRLWGCWGAKRR